MNHTQPINITFMITSVKYSYIMQGMQLCNYIFPRIIINPQMNIYMLIYKPTKDEIHKNEPIQPLNINL